MCTPQSLVPRPICSLWTEWCPELSKVLLKVTSMAETLHLSLLGPVAAIFDCLVHWYSDLKHYSECESKVMDNH